MNESIVFLTDHGYLMVFLWVLAEQMGLPLPSTVVLLVAGAASAFGQLSLGSVVLIALVASTLSDVIWYEIGRRKGMAVLGLLCRVSLEPDSCVRRTEERFAQHGVRSLLVAKFVPGLNTAAPPLAGMFGMGFLRFLLFDALGGLFWIGTSTLLGYLFAHQLEDLVAWARQFGLGVGILLGLCAVLYVGWKFLQRRRFIREISVSAIAPEELKRMLDSGDAPFIVDLRHAVDIAANPARLPGALQMSPSAIRDGMGRLPGDREIVLYCT